MTIRYSNNGFVTVLDPLPYEQVGWYCKVLSETDYSTIIAQVFRFKELQFQKDKNGIGGGYVVIDSDDPIWTAALPAGQTTALVDQQAIWQVYEDGILRAEFFAEDVEQDIVTEDGDRVTKIAGRGLGSVLTWGIEVPSDATNPDRTDIGYPMATFLAFLTAVQARGTLTFVTPLFDAEEDSQGFNWTESYALTRTAGDNLYDTFTTWCDQLGAQWKMLSGFRLWIERQNGVDRTATVVFPIGSAQQTQSKKRTRREIGNVLYVGASDGSMAMAADSTSQAKWKKRERWIDAGQAGDSSAAGAAANANIDLFKDQRVSREVQVVPDGPGRRLFVDYDVMDWVTIEADSDDTDDSQMQVIAATVTVDEDSYVQVELALGTRFDAREVEVQRQMEKLQSRKTPTKSVSKKKSVKSEIALRSVGDLKDVDTTTTPPAAGDTLIYNSVTNVYETKPNTFDQLIDVDMTGLADGMVPTWDDTTSTWLPGTGGGGGGGGALVPLMAGSVTAASDLKLDAIPGGYTEYLIKIQFRCSVAAQYIKGYLRNAAADVTAAGYSWTFARAYSTESVDNVGYNGVAGWYVGYSGIANQNQSLELKVSGLTQALATAVISDGVSEWSSSAAVRNHSGMVHDAANAYTGIRLYPEGGGTITAEYIVYGYSPTVPVSQPAQDRRWVAAAAHAQNDEFNDGSLAAAWVRVDTAGESSFQEILEGGDSLSIRNGIGNDGAGPKLHGLVKPYALAVGEYVQCHIRTVGRASNYPAFGLVASDGVTAGAGNQHVTMFIPAVGFYGVTHGAWTNWNSRTAGFADVVLPAGAVEFHYRMKRDASNVWRVSISTDGVLWDELSTHTHALTPTHVGLVGTGWGSTTPRTFSVDYFRVGT